MRLSPPRGEGSMNQPFGGTPSICFKDRLSCMMIFGIVGTLMKKFD
jgi:hypothetical protein